MRTLKDLESSGRDATPEEQARLVQFTGWGAVKNVFDDLKAREYQRAREGGWEPAPETARWYKKWGKLYDELKSFMTEDEWRAARESTANAHYTSREVIGALWDAARRFGFKGGTVLEPAAGIGHFLGLMPQDLASKSKLVAVELDDLSGRILEKLYPKATVFRQGFETVDTPKASADLAITNVPFYEVGPADARTRYGRTMNLHNYFIARMLDALKPGGLGIVITSHWTLDSAKMADRKLFAEKANLIGAIRLPNTAFAENAGTEVTTDVLFFRKPVSPADRGGESFVMVQKIPVAEEGKAADVNEYFARRPEQMLGQPSVSGTMRGGEDEFTLLPNDEPLDQQLREAIARIAPSIATVPGERFAETDYEKLKQTQEAARQYVDGTLSIGPNGPVVYQGGEAVPIKDVEPRLAGAVGRVRAQAFINLRDELDAHLALMRTDASDAEVTKSRNAFEKLYDDWVRRFGALNGPYNASLFQFDMGYYRLAGVEREVVETVGGKRRKRYDKGEIFRKRTIVPLVEPTSADSLEDAIRITMNYRGRLDLDYMAGLLGQEAAETIKMLLSSGRAFENPDSGQLETKEQYLSGNVKKKLRDAEAAAASEPQRWTRNVEALKEVQPARIGIKDLTARLGATWITSAIVMDLMRSLGVRSSVAYNAAIDRWVVGYAEDNERWKTSRQSTQQILTAALNLQQPVIYDTIREGDAERRVINAAETQAAQDMVNALQETFSRWIRSNEAVIEIIEDAYNETFNFWRETDWDGSLLTLPGLAEGQRLYPNQKNVVWRLLQMGYGMVAHAVGAGKTRVLIATAMEMRRLGLARKPMVVVHNATIGQFAATWQAMYPSAKLLITTKRDFETKNRKRLMGRIATGDWDAVVLAQSQVNLIPNSSETIRRESLAQIEELETAMADVAKSEGRRSPSVREIEKAIRSARKRMDDLLQAAEKRQDKGLTFEELGVDALFVDEAHAYKKPPFVTKLGNIAALQKQVSATAMQMRMKARAVQAVTRGRNVIFATGTPVTNTLAELWHHIGTIAPDKLKEFGVQTFDRFVGTFATPEMVQTMDAAGRWKMKLALARFQNGYQLAQFVRSVFDVVTPEDLREKLKLEGRDIPAIEGGKPELVIVPITDRVSRFIRQVVLPALEWYEQLTGRARRAYSYIPVVANSVARAAALDVRLVLPGAVDDPGSKVNTCVRNVLQIAKENDGTQVIFCDRMNAVKTNAITSGAIERMRLEESPEGEEDEPEEDLFLFRDITRKLVAGGMPAEQVAIINDYNTEARRAALIDRFNRGEVRVLMGSTQKLGTGLNIQEKLFAAHHLDAPYMPSELEQRNGRILRAGNENATVRVLYYGMEKTLDVLVWALLDRKSKIVFQALSGKAGAEFEDGSNELSFSAAVMIAELLGDPRIFQRLELENTVRTLKLAEEAFENNKARQREQLRNRRASAAGRLKTLRAWEDRLGRWEKEESEPEVVVGTQRYAGAEAARAIDAALTDKAIQAAASERQGVGRTVAKIRIGDITYSVSASESLASGRIVIHTRGEDAFGPVYTGAAATSGGLMDAWKRRTQLAKDGIAAEKEAIAANDAKIAQLEQVLGERWEKAGELSEAKAKLAELNKALLEASSAKASGESQFKPPTLEEGEAESDDAYAPAATGEKPEPPEIQGVTVPGSWKSETERVSQHAIIAYMQNAFGVKIAAGYLRGALGIYKRIMGRAAPEVIRVLGRLYGHLGLVSHEVAHHVMRQNRALFAKLTDGQLGELRALDYEPLGRPREGFAEWWRILLVDGTTEAERAAPLFAAYMRGVLSDPRNAALASAVRRTQEFVGRWKSQGAFGRVASNMRDDRNPFRDPTRGWATVFGDGAKSLWRAFQVRFLDRFRPLEEMQQARERAGISSLEGDSAYEYLSAMAHSAPGEALRAIEEGPHHVAESAYMRRLGVRGLFEPLMEVLTSRDEYEKWRAFAYAWHARSLWANVDQEGNPDPIDPGISREDADYVYGQLYSPEWEKLAQHVKDFNDALVDVAVEAGVITADEGERIKGKRDTYLPLRAILPGDPYGRAAPLNMAKFVDPHSPFHRVRGAQLPRLDPLVATIERTQEIYTRAIQQQAALRLWDEMRRTPASSRWVEEVPANAKITRVAVEEAQAALESMGYTLSGSSSQDAFNLYRPDYATFDGKPVRRIVVNGKQKLIYFHDADFLKTVESMSELAIPYFLDLVFGRAASLFKLGVVGINLGFAAANLPSDALTYLAQSRQPWLSPSRWLEPVRMLVAYPATKLAAAAGKTGDPVVELMLRAGFDSLLASQQLRGHRAVPWRFRRHTPLTLGQAAVGGALSLAQEVVSSTEASWRLAEAAYVLKQGGYGRARLARGDIPPQRLIIAAINAARGVTTPFTRSGTWGRALNRVMPTFFNAILQMGEQYRRHWRDKPRATAVKTAAFIALGIVYGWYSWDDAKEEAPPWWYEYWVGSRDGRASLKVPKRGWWGATIAFGEMLARTMRQQERLGHEVTSWVKQTAKGLTPGFGLPVIGPAFEAYMGYDFFRGRPIDDMRQQGLPPGERFYPWTTRFARWVGGKVGVSPTRMEHFLEGATGGLYGTAARAAEGRPDNPLMRFGFRRLYSQSVDEFYDALRAAQEARASERRGGVEGGEHAAEARRLERLAELAKGIRDLIPEDADVETRFGYERFLVGLARHALGKEPLPSYPNPLVADAPPDIDTVRLDKIGSWLAQAAERPRWRSGMDRERFRERVRSAAEYRDQVMGELDDAGTPTELRQAAIRKYRLRTGMR